MNKGLNWLVGGIIAIGIVLMLGYSNLQGKKLDVENQLAKVQSTMQRNTDLIPNLVSNLKGFYRQHQALVDSVTNAREAMAGAKTPAEFEKASKEFGTVSKDPDGTFSGTGAIGRLLVVMENYPDPRGIELSKDLGIALEGSANRLKFERDALSDRTTVYNRAVTMPPSSVFAWLFHFEPMPLFEAKAGAEKFPSVNFDE